MVNLIKIGNKFINADCISYIDIEEMTIYLNSSDGLTAVYYDSNDFYDSEEFENVIMKAFNKYEIGNPIFK